MEPIRWRTDAGAIPNEEGARIRVLARDVDSITEFVYVVGKDEGGRHFLSTDGTRSSELPTHLVAAWRRA